MDFDVVIVGGGIVGLSTACALLDSNMNIAIVDSKKDLYCELDDQHPAIRASAINFASQRYFEQINIWQSLQNSGRICAFDSIDVMEKNGFAKLKEDATHYQTPHLGYIIENQLMQNALYSQLKCHSNVQIFTHHVNDIYFSSDRGFIELDQDIKIATKLIIGADGANSFIRRKNEFKIISRPYRHNAIIATIKTELPHNNCARQIFYQDGIIAFLPLWQSNLSCLVWSSKPTNSVDLLTCDISIFNQKLTQMTDNLLGDCNLVSDRWEFPLTARYCPKPVKNRVILIGDASHTIHPLAGQGVNLGLEDSKQLTDLIRQRFEKGDDIGNPAYYHAYQLCRNKDTLAMLGAMKTIQDMFNGSSVVKKAVRGIGMNAINMTPKIKQYLIRYALG